MTTDNGSTSQKYGVPIYGAAWVPPSTVPKESTESETESSTIRHVILAGGGGEGRSGIPNAILLSSFDSVSLPEDPVSRLGTGSDLPYRIAVHPGGEGVLCSLPTSCKWYEWEADEGRENHVLSLTQSERVLEQLEDVGQQLAMTFNNDGNLLAVGGEDGKLRVFKWPAMENIIDEENAHSRVKDLDFSSDGKLLVSVGSGPGRIWNVSTSAALATLSKENDEIFSFCRFSQSSDTDQVLYITANRDKGGSIIKWNTTSWKRISSTYVGRDGITAFNVSPDGKLLAIGTNEGGILILSTTSMRVQTVVKKAHLAFVTAVAFSQDSRALLSASLDSSVRVTLVQDKKEGMSAWMILCIIVLLIAIVAVLQPHFMQKVKDSFL